MSFIVTIMIIKSQAIIFIKYLHYLYQVFDQLIGRLLNLLFSSWQWISFRGPFNELVRENSHQKRNESVLIEWGRQVKLDAGWLQYFFQDILVVLTELELQSTYSAFPALFFSSEILNVGQITLYFFFILLFASIN